MILDECIYNINNLRDIVKWDYIYLNIDQRIIFDIFCQAIASNEENMFFLNKFDNIKKIFLINLILIKIQFNEKIALIIIFSNIIIILLNEDIMIYSWFKISIDINSNFICNISAQSHLIELIWETKLIF